MHASVPYLAGSSIRTNSGKLWPRRVSPGSAVGWIALVGSLYLLAARLGLTSLPGPDGIAPIWLPAGIFLSAILLTRPEVRLHLVVTLCIADFVSELLAGTPWIVSGIYALALTGDAVLSAWLLTRFVGVPLTFAKTRDVVGFVALVVGLSNGLTALVAAAAAGLIPGTSFWSSWWSWAAADGIGNLLVTPLALSWTDSTRDRARPWNVVRMVEAAALFVPLAALNILALSHLPEAGLFSLLLPYTTFPFLIWAALRFGMRGVTATLGVLTAIVVPFAVADRLPTFHFFGTPVGDIIVIQMYLAVMAIPSLLLGASVAERSRAVDTLGEKEALLNKAEEIAAVGSWELDLQANRLVWSDEVYRIFGVAPHAFEASYEGFLDAVHPEDRAAVDRAYSESLREGRDDYEIDHRVVRKSTGEVRHVHERCEHSRDASGRVVRSVGMVHDITAAVLAEQTLRESESRFRAIFEDSPIAIWEEDFSAVKERFEELRRSGVADIRAYLDLLPDEVSAMAARVRVIAVNQEAARVLGCDSREALAKELPRYFTAESFLVFREELLTLAEGRTRFRSEIPLVTHDGRPVLFDLTLSVAPGHEHTLSRVLVSFVDITGRRRSEDAFRALSRRNEEALRIARMGHWEFDIRTGLFTFNDQYFQLHGMSVETVGSYQMTAEAFASHYVHPDDGRLVHAAIEQAAATDDPAFQLETDARILRADGEVRSVVVWFRIEKDEQGKTIRLYGVNQDITERRRAEEALRERDRYIEAILENAPIGFAINRIHDGTTVFVGGRFEDIYGVPRGSVRSVEEFFERVYRDPKFREEMRARITADMASGDVSRMRWEDIPITTADGERRFVTARNIPVPDQNLMVSTVQDVTARHRAESALRESEERFRTLIEQAGDGFELLDGDGRYVDANSAACRQLGCSREELLRSTVVDIDPKLTLDRYASTFRELVGKPPMTFESTHRRFDGTSFPVEISTSVVRLGDDLRAVTLVRDITERKRAEQERERLLAQLMQSQKMESVGRLAGGVAHDFNNMLGVILGNAELALMDAGPDEAVRDCLQQIQAAASRSADLTRQLLAFARKQTIAPKVLDLNDAVTGMLKMLQRLIGEDIDLAWIPRAEMWPVRLDPAQIDQILANLCVNARDAIAGVGRVTIETAKVTFDDAYCVAHPGSLPGQFVMLAVSDDGSGMTKDVLDHLFEPFFTTKDFGRGTGLGLATVYGIVRQNNGFINVYSEPGRGTTFRIYLPRFQSDVVEDIEGPEEGTPRGGTETVLLVEDEGMILKLGMSILDSLGYTVLGALTPGEALSIAAQYDGPIHLLITDVVMPEMNGRELRDRIAAQRPGTRTLFISGYTADAIAHHGVLEDGLQFLQKPFSIRSLAAKVRESLDG